MSSETGINGHWYPTSIFLQRRATQGKASLTQSFQCVLRGHYRLKSQGKRPRLHTAEVYLIELAGQVDPEGERDPGEKKEQGKQGHSGRATSPGLQTSLVRLMLKLHLFKGISRG